MSGKLSILYHAVAFVVVAIWGSTFVFTKLLLLGGLTPAQIFVLRFVIAYLMLLVFCLWRGIRWVSDSWKDELLMVLLGLTGLYAVFSGLELGAQETGSRCSHQLRLLQSRHHHHLCLADTARADYAFLYSGHALDTCWHVYG